MSDRLRGLIATLIGFGLMAAAPIHLQSNRATYKVSLAHALPGGLVAVRGRIVIEFRRTCHAYVTTQRFISDMTNTGGSVSRSDFVVQASEDQSGHTMRFEITNLVDGRMAEHFKGRATRGSNGAGKVHLTTPKGREFDLPKGTIFPAMQTIAVLEAAHKGRQNVSGMVFQGGGKSDLYYSTSTIGAKLPATASARAAARAGNMLKGVSVWPVLMSYYKPGGDGETPDYEISARLYANGVIGSMEMIYPRFTLKAKLVKVETLSPPRC